MTAEAFTCKKCEKSFYNYETGGRDENGFRLCVGCAAPLVVEPEPEPTPEAEAGGFKLTDDVRELIGVDLAGGTPPEFNEDGDTFPCAWCEEHGNEPVDRPLEEFAGINPDGNLVCIACCEIMTERKLAGEQQGRVLEFDPRAMRSPARRIKALAFDGNFVPRFEQGSVLEVLRNDLPVTATAVAQHFDPVHCLFLVVYEDDSFEPVEYGQPIPMFPLDAVQITARPKLRLSAVEAVEASKKFEELLEDGRKARVDNLAELKPKGSNRRRKKRARK